MLETSIERVFSVRLAKGKNVMNNRCHERVWIRIPLLIVLVMSSLVHITDARSRGSSSSSGSKSSGTSSSSRTSSSSSFSSSSKTSSYSSRSSGYGTYKSSRSPAPRTAIRTNNYGGFSGRRSSSYNGFGLGLGAGLIIGRTGYLGRPIGYTNSGYGYNYIHRYRDYDTSTPIKCLQTNYTEYFKTLSSDQEMNIDEGEVTCSSTEDVCVGRMQLTAVNVTESGSSTKLQGFKVNIWKGCGKNTTLTAKESGSFSATRQCWIGALDQAISAAKEGDKRRILGQTEMPSDIIKEIKSDVSSDAFIEFGDQTETCMCSGHFCNGAINARKATATTVAAGVFLLLLAAMERKDYYGF